MEDLKISWDKLNNPSKETMNARDKFLKECIITFAKIVATSFAENKTGVLVDAG
jgi:hypothetical protein